jgi:hypothetical protein
MRVIVASGRGLLSGWLIAVAIPLLVDAHTSLPGLPRGSIAGRACSN